MDVMLTIWVSRRVGLWVGKLKSFRHIMCLRLRCRMDLVHAPPSTTSPLQGCSTACIVPARVFDIPASLEVNHCFSSRLCLLPTPSTRAGGRCSAFFPPELPTPYPLHTPPGSPPGLPSFAPRQASSKGHECPVSKLARLTFLRGFPQGHPFPAVPEKSLVLGCVLCVGASKNKLGPLAVLQIKTILPA